MMPNPNSILPGKVKSPRNKRGGLQESSQANSNDLLAPLVKAVRISSGNAEHVQGSHRDLNQQDAAPLDIGEENFDDAVCKGNERQNVKQADLYL